MYIFGGGDGKRLSKSIIALDLENKEWYKPLTNGTPPAARLQHTSFTYDDKLYIFGGESTTSAPLKDLHYYHTKSMTWKKPTLTKMKISKLSTVVNSEEINKEAPSLGIHQRVSPGNTVVNNNVFIFGGYDGEDWLNDFFAIDLETYEVKAVSYSEKIEGR